MGAEFDGDADADDEVDEGDGVEADGGEGHDAEDVGDDHGDCEGYDQPCSEGAEKEGGQEEDDCDGGAEERACEGDYRGVLVEEDVEFAVGENGDGLR